MRIVTYNVEWFTNLFDREGRLLNDDQWSGRQDVTRAQQVDALAQVFQALDADAIMVIEAPDSHSRRDGEAALETFAAAAGLRACRALIGFANDTQQEIALLYDPDKVTVQHDPQGAETGKHGSAEAPRFDGVFRLDLDVDRTPDTVVWSKPPLEVAATLPDGRALRLIGVHAKSKAPHGARGEDEIMRVSIANRRKQLAQCIWLRQRVEQHLDAGDSLIVLGDFNDGPGLDEYEKLFGHSSVEIVMGENGGQRLYDPHARMALSQRVGARPSSARFRVPPDGRYLNALLDYIMVSEDLLALNPRWTIWHPFEDPDCYGDKALREALLTASDHFPVALDIEI